MIQKTYVTVDFICWGHIFIFGHFLSLAFKGEVLHDFTAVDG